LPLFTFLTLFIFSGTFFTWFRAKRGTTNVHAEDFYFMLRSKINYNLLLVVALYFILSH